jgi:hypothetical protein
MKYGLMGIGAALLLTSVPANAEMVRGQTPDSVAAAMRAKGLLADVGKDDTGDPMIRSQFGGVKWTVFFYNCANHKDCATVQFYAGYHFKDKAIPLDKINEWNRNKRFSRAYIDKVNDPVIEMDVDLDDGGMSQALFIDNIEFWQTLMNEFQDHIGFND